MFAWWKRFQFFYSSQIESLFFKVNLDRVEEEMAAEYSEEEEDDILHIGRLLISFHTFLIFLVAILLYKSKCPSVSPYVNHV